MLTSRQQISTCSGHPLTAHQPALVTPDSPRVRVRSSGPATRCLPGPAFHMLIPTSLTVVSFNAANPSTRNLPTHLSSRREAARRRRKEDGKFDSETRIEMPTLSSARSTNGSMFWLCCNSCYKQPSELILYIIQRTYNSFTNVSFFVCPHRLQCCVTLEFEWVIFRDCLGFFSR